MSKQKILVLGYFGYKNNQLDGQTVKTRNIFELMKSREGIEFSEVNFFDTQIFKLNKLFVFNALIKICRSNLLYYIPAHNNLKYMFPIIYILSVFFFIKIHYVVVGGWLIEYLKNKSIHRWMLANIKGIYPQTKVLCDRLENNYGFKNVYQLHNYRITTFIPPHTKKKQKDIKLVFMARVHPKKGIEVLFKLSEKLHELKINNVFIDIYGPISIDYQECFQMKLKSALQNIKYLGVLETDEIYGTLSRYDLMLFPTKYYTEGFPGSILDAYISGIPVISTDWKYASEFIKDNESGIIIEFDNTNEFISKVIDVIQSPIVIDSLQEGVKLMSKQYSPERAWEIFKKYI